MELFRFLPLVCQVVANEVLVDQTNIRRLEVMVEVVEHALDTLMATIIDGGH